MNRERAAHPSTAQIHSLLNFLEKNPSLAKGFPKVPSARDAVRKSWEKLALQLNNLGGCVKTWKQWTKYWADKKSAVKKKGALRLKTRNKTSGDKEAVKLSEIEERILTLMGGESFATGDRHLEICPLEAQTKQSSKSPSLLASTQLRGLNPVPFLPMEEQSTSSLIGDLPVENDPFAEVSLSPSTMVSSPPCTPPTVRGPGPSGSGRYPQRLRNVRRQLIGSPVHNHSLPNTTTRVGRSRQSSVTPPSQRRSQSTRLSERLLAIEEQKLKISRRNLELFERLVNETVKGIREGFQLLADILKK